MGVEDKHRFNFSCAATIWPKMAAAVMKKRRNSHPVSNLWLSFNKCQRFYNLKKWCQFQKVLELFSLKIILVVELLRNCLIKLYIFF